MLVRVDGISTDDSRIYELSVTVDEEGFAEIRNLTKQSYKAKQCRIIEARIDALLAELAELRK